MGARQPRGLRQLVELGLALGLLALLGLTFAPSPGIARRTAGVVVHHLPTGEAAFTDGRYLYTAATYLSGAKDPSSAGVIWDSRTGTVRHLSLPEDCAGQYPAMGAGRLFFLCAVTGGGQRALIYTIANRTWRSPPGIDDACGAGEIDPYGEQNNNCTVIDVGSRWVEWSEDPCYHCDSVTYYNVDSGAVESYGYEDDPGWTDLNGPTLTKLSACAPLEADEVLGFIGLRTGVLLGSDLSSMYVQRCGSSRRITLTNDLGQFYTAGPGVVMWSTNRSRQFSGYDLQHRRRFTLSLPGTIPNFVDGFILGGRLYLENFSTGAGYWVALTPLL